MLRQCKKKSSALGSYLAAHTVPPSPVLIVVTVIVSNEPHLLADAGLPNNESPYAVGELGPQS